MRVVVKIGSSSLTDEEGEIAHAAIEVEARFHCTGPRTVVMTTAGGWGVVCADAITRSTLTLADLPDDASAYFDD